MRQVRKCVFETNSSSTHSISICSAQEFQEFKQGLRLLDTNKDKLIPTAQHHKDAITYSQWLYKSGLNTYAEHYTTPSGDKIVAFGLYGYD